MKRSDFIYDLPKELIAQHPLEHREDSRLLVLTRASGELCDDQFQNLTRLLQPGDLLVFNDTRVIPARIFGKKESGGNVEVLIERILEGKKLVAQIRASKPPREGSRIYLDEEHNFVVTGRDNGFFHLEVGGDDEIFSLLDRFGHIPLPPYIQRADELDDVERYQTVYAKNPGAVAAPTAGLHFSDALIMKLKDNHISCGFVTLHVGAGTFQPVRCDDIQDHKMHKEWFSVSEALCQQVELTKQNNGRVIAVGTTVVRTLESAASGGKLVPASGDTDIFIYPGYEFHTIDGLITNFHLPESTLLMLISAFAGRDIIMEAYQHAISKRYRFFSYGDAMLIL